MSDAIYQAGELIQTLLIAWLAFDIYIIRKHLL